MSLKSSESVYGETEMELFVNLCSVPDLFLLRRQLAPLVSEHPSDFWEGHVWSLGPQLLPTVVHKPHISC